MTRDEFVIVEDNTLFKVSDERHRLYKSETCKRKKHVRRTNGQPTKRLEPKALKKMTENPQAYEQTTVL